MRDVYALWTRNVLIGRVRGPCDCIRSHSLVRAQVPRGRADFVSNMALAAYFGSGWVRLADGLRATQIEHQSSVTHQDSKQLNRFLGMSSINRYIAASGRRLGTGLSTEVGIDRRALAGRAERSVPVFLLGASCSQV